MLVCPNKVLFEDNFNRDYLLELRQDDPFLVHAPIGVVEIIAVQELQEDLAAIGSHLPQILYHPCGLFLVRIDG